MTPTIAVVANRRHIFAQGTRIRLVRMDDFQAPPAGTEDTVRFVDDIGQIHVPWDNGSSLAVAFEDVIERI